MKMAVMVRDDANDGICNNITRCGKAILTEVGVINITVACDEIDC